MKKSIIVTIGVVLILIVLGVWGYLLFFGTPKGSDEIFANLGIGTGGSVTDTGVAIEETSSEEGSQLAMGGASLQQLTTRPVAGFGYVGTSSKKVRYVEQGTAHVYEIDLESGEESRIAATTIPRVVDAVFSPEGASVALVSAEGNDTTVLAGMLTSDNPDYITLQDGAFDPFFLDENTLRYAVHTGNGVRGYKLDITENTPQQLFTVPFESINMLWDGGETHFFNKTAANLEGALYQVVGGYVKPRSKAAFGLTAGLNSDYYLVTKRDGKNLTSEAINRGGEETTALAVLFIPEKCAMDFTDTALLWCAAPFDQQPASFIEDWYKGAVTSEDYLWLVDIERGRAQLEENLFEEARRLIDIDGIEVGNAGVLFRNKIDNTLWLYDPTV